MSSLQHVLQWGLYPSTLSIKLPQELMNLLLALCLGALWLLVAVGGWLVWQMLRQNGRMLLRLDELEGRLDGLEVGEDAEPAALLLDAAAPEFELPDLAGKSHTLAQFRGHRVLLIFFNLGCGYCHDLAPKLALLGGSGELDPTFIRPEETLAQPVGGERGEEDPLRLVISTGDPESKRQFFKKHPLTCPVLLQREMEVAAAYQTNGTPTGYLISAEGKIASKLAIGAEALMALATRKSAIVSPKPEMDQDHTQEAGVRAGNGDGRESRFSDRSLARTRIKRDGLRAGTRAPEFRLPRLDGQGELELADLRGRYVLLVFSDPHCGPCQAVAPGLEAFHRERPEVAVVMISRGEPKENRAKVKEHGLTFTVLLQRQLEISRLYAMFATPMAYLIDEHGIITNDVAVGVEAILGLVAKAGMPAHCQRVGALV